MTDHEKGLVTKEQMRELRRIATRRFGPSRTNPERTGWVPVNNWDTEFDLGPWYCCAADVAAAAIDRIKEHFTDNGRQFKWRDLSLRGWTIEKIALVQG
jgi:hypothetical protein